VSARRRAAAAAVLACLGAAPAAPAHGPPPPPEEVKVPQGDLIPESDRESYLSRVTSVSPAVPGLRARILGHQDLLELTWRGARPLLVLGAQGEPMFRLGRRGVEVNRHSPTAWSSTERYGRLRVPDYAHPRAAPRWQALAGPGPWRWSEHRAQWMTGRRPRAVGDGAARRRIRAWTVPLRAGDRTVRIRGTLEWIPNPAAARAPRTDSSSPLLSLAILLAAMSLGAAAGARLRDHSQPQNESSSSQNESSSSNALSDA